MFGSVAKWAVEIDDVNRIPEILARPWVTATTGRPRPVVIALPEDMLTSLNDAAPARIAEPAPEPAAMDATLAKLQAAARPLILIGGSNWTGAGRAAGFRRRRRHSGHCRLPL
jgi:acetolactate synthase I/II/III large subunit